MVGGQEDRARMNGNRNDEELGEDSRRRKKPWL